MRNIPLVCALLLAACAAQANKPSSADSLKPYLTSTPAQPAAPNVVVANTPLPSATPMTYIIQSGDTISGLAERFHVAQDDLIAANPDVDPNSMTIGKTLLIPNSSPSLAASTPTPAPAPVTQAVCHPTADNGLWCFALIQNNTTDLLENVSAQITLIDSNGAAVASQIASTPLDIIAPNTSMPVYAFFANAPANATPQIQLLSAIQTNANDARYLPAKLNNTLAQIRWDGLSAQVSGQVYLPPESKAATQVWVAAVAYDKNGTVIGVKRWEGGALQPGTSASFSFLVAGLRSAIDAVDFFVEAR